MTFNPEIHHRRSIRLRGYDYAQPGAYFVTICTHGRECLFGEIVNGEMRLNLYGRIVEECWQTIPHHFDGVKLDEFVVMPNHVHGILNIVEQRRGTACRAPTTGTEQFGQPRPHSLPTIIRSFKSAATQRVNQSRGTPGTTVWQRNYYEHVVRGDADLDRIRVYILDNPAKWHEDPNNPENISKPGR